MNGGDFKLSLSKKGLSRIMMRRCIGARVIAPRLGPRAEAAMVGLVDLGEGVVGGRASGHKALSRWLAVKTSTSFARLLWIE